MNGLIVLIWGHYLKMRGVRGAANLVHIYYTHCP